MIFIVVLLGLSVFVYNMGQSAPSEVNQINLSNLPQDAVLMEVFHSDTCPYCHRLDAFVVSTLEPKYPNLVVVRYDVTKRDTVLKFQEYAEKYSNLDPNRLSTPITIIGEDAILGLWW